MKTLFGIIALLGAQAMAQPRVVELPSQSPLVTFRIVFLAGAAQDSAQSPGTAALTALMLAEGGTREMTYKQILDAMFPMATSVSVQVDKEMTTFSATTHTDNLDAFYKIFSNMLLDPGWRKDDLERNRDKTINYLTVSLRGNNDEELGKEVLYNQIYAGHPYGHHNAGTVSSLRKLTMASLQKFYKENYTQSNLIIGLAGGYSKEFLTRIKNDFSKLPKGKPSTSQLPEPKPAKGIQLTMVEKDTRSVAYSLGFPIEVRRGHPDYPALLVAQSYFGQHRMSGGRLYERMRQIRGLNYGDYAYIEYFPNGMYQLQPDPNLGRRQQIFQIWIRPVEPEMAHFSLRLTLWELDRLVRQGLTAEEFDRTRTFLTKYVNLLTSTKSAELGYAIDSHYYGIPEYTEYLKKALANLKPEDVNRAIRKHLQTQNIHIVAIAKDSTELRKKILENTVSPMTYNAPKPDEVLKEDKIIERFKIDLKPESVRIVPVGKIFE